MRATTMENELRKIPIFSKLSEKTIEKLISILSKKEFKKGEILFLREK